MKLSARAEYACLAIVALAQHTDGHLPLTAKAIAEEFDIPPRLLEQVLLRLKAAGIVRSTRGIFGGHALARQADEISLADVLRAVENTGAARKKRGTASETLHAIIDDLSDMQDAMLQQISIARLAERIRSSQDRSAAG